MVGIRRAKHEDIDWLLHELKRFDDSFGAHHKLLGDVSYASETLKKLIDEHLFLVAEHDEHGLVGFISGLIAPHLFNPALMTLTETFWWVPPEHRGSRAGLLLLNAFTEWGESNVDWINFTLEDTSQVAERTLARRGYKLKERNFYMEVV